MVTIRAVKPMAVPVTLGQIKSDDRLAEMALVRQSRLSVTPVSAEHWAIIMEMGKTSL
jgi:predicted RNA-binding protein with PUA-like domain